MPEQSTSKLVVASQGKTVSVRLEGPIGFDWFGEGMSAEKFRALINDASEQGAERLVLEVHSPGGVVEDAMDMFTAISDFNGEVEGYVTGLAASSASFILMAADTVKMPKNTMLHLHNPRGGRGGTAKSLRKDAENLEAWQTVMFDCYADKYTGSADDLRRIMDEDTFLNPEAAAKTFKHIEVIPVDAKPQAQFQATAMCGAKDSEASRFFAEEAPTLASRIKAALHLSRKSKPQEDADMNEADTKKLVEESVTAAMSGLSDTIVAAVQEAVKASTAPTASKTVKEGEGDEIVIAFEGDPSKQEDVDAHLAKLKDHQLEQSVNWGDPKSVSAYHKARFGSDEEETATVTGSNSGIDPAVKTKTSAEDRKDTMACMLASLGSKQAG